MIFIIIFFIFINCIIMTDRSKVFRLPLYLYVFMCLIVLCLLFVFQKGPMEIWLNKLHTPALDVFFKYITYFGDGIMYGLLAIILLFRSFFHFILVGFVALFQTIPVQLMKRVIFSDISRPSVYFDRLDIPANFVEGVKVCSSYSFPSGHTATAFSIAILISYCFGRNKTWVWMLSLTFATMAAISRVYLMQHFFIDILVGSLLGTLIASGTIIWFEKIRRESPSKSNLWEWSFQSYFLSLFQSKT